MSKLLKDPYAKYGEAKEVRRFGEVSQDEKAPDYNEVKKAMLIRRMLWTIPGTVVLGLLTWLSLLFGPAFFWSVVWTLVGAAGIMALVVGIAYMCHLGSESNEVLESAKKRGVREPSND